MDRNFQSGVRKWMLECFGEESIGALDERKFRFMEEAIELFQSLNGSKEDILTLCDYVYNRPMGEVKQEIGGTLLTLAGICNAMDVDGNELGMSELRRVKEKSASIKRKREGWQGGALP